tara:strand:+ start:19234 stop:19641 length:408 start_codon:yes stop_codon:yes gene_type:complete
MRDNFSKWKYPDIKDSEPTIYNWLVQNLDGFFLGFETDIGAFSYINALHGVVIEDRVQIGSHCSIYSISTIDKSHGKVVLKQNCKIGSHSTILPGVTVGKNSIIGAHSLVNKDIPDNTLAYGVPAKVKRKLNDDE